MSHSCQYLQVHYVRVPVRVTHAAQASVSPMHGWTHAAQVYWHVGHALPQEQTNRQQYMHTAGAHAHYSSAGALGVNCSPTPNSNKRKELSGRPGAARNLVRQPAACPPCHLTWWIAFGRMVKVELALKGASTTWPLAALM